MDADGFDPFKFHKVFTLDTDEDAAAARFVEVYSQPPEVIREHNRQLWVGPVPDKKEGEA